MNHHSVAVASRAIELALRGEAFQIEDLQRILSDAPTPETCDHILQDLESDNWLRHEEETWQPGVRAYLLAGVELPTPDISGCVAAVDAAREYIQAHDGATRDEIIHRLAPEDNYRIGLTAVQMVGKLGEIDEYRQWWWYEIIKPGLASLPDIEAPAHEDGLWSPATERTDSSDTG